eukprot:CAMPEP_0171321084 /NCGR_PEP_ID=MMETSP0816-20121228/109309_1 /TAXON_ID=420281 /ORGANISM="Proboscia inermis, Strain CCAP1064/1" /LENGTH=68 /DNA_ID=CAMNT_0011818665 /DNA_START=169 /DNA_END=375 /DNA_ORIENTATION=-
MTSVVSVEIGQYSVHILTLLGKNMDIEKPFDTQGKSANPNTSNVHSQKTKPQQQQHITNVPNSTITPA